VGEGPLPPGGRGRRGDTPAYRDRVDTPYDAQLQNQRGRG
jgi:hypothetical protein